MFRPGFRTVPTVLSLYGCEIAPQDADRLVDALLEHDTAASLEAAAAIRFGSAARLNADELEPDMRAAILGVLDPPPPGLVGLRRELKRAERRARIEHSHGAASSVAPTTRERARASASRTAGAAERGGGESSAGTSPHARTRPWSRAGTDAIGREDLHLRRTVSTAWRAGSLPVVFRGGRGIHVEPNVWMRDSL